MTKRDQMLAAGFAVPGMMACLGALLSFLLDMTNGRLGWRPGLAARDFHLLLGKSYSHGFATGFFLCFSLILAGAALRAWRAQRQATP